MRELTLEQRIARLERIVESYSNDTRTRKDELFGGLIGAVNADKKDCQKVASALKSDYIIKNYTDVYACDFMFDLSVSFAYNEKLYEIKIKDTEKSKITVALYKDGKDYYEDMIKGLRMNTSAIVKAVKQLMNSVSNNYEDIEKASKCTSRQVRRQLDREERERAAAWEREREALRKASKNYDYDDDNSSSRKSSSSDRVSSSRDWYEINPRYNAEIDGYEYGRL